MLQIVVAEGKLFNDSESGDLLLLFITKSKKNACHSGARGQLEGTRSMQNYGFKGKKTLKSGWRHLYSTYLQTHLFVE